MSPRHPLRPLLPVLVHGDDSVPRLLSDIGRFHHLPGRRLRPHLVDSETALEQAKAYARAERERL